MNSNNDYKVVLVKDLISYDNTNENICLINFKDNEISLSQIYNGQELLLHKVARFSNQNQNVCVLFAKISLFELPVKMGAFVLDCGTLLGLTEQGKILANNIIDVFETSRGRLAILIFYYLETLNVDLIIVFCSEEDIERVLNRCGDISCVFLVQDKILFN